MVNAPAACAVPLTVASESFESGLRRTIDWYLEHPEWIDAARQSHVGQRLGLASTT